MATSTKNVKLGVCKVYYDGRDLGLTQGGVEVSVATETYKIEVDQFGKTSINDLIMGRNITVKVPMAETTLRNLVAIMPGASLVTDGVQAAATLSFASNPANGDSVSIYDKTFTFQTAKPTSVFQVQIGVTAAETVANLVAAINRSLVADALGGVTATASADGMTVTIQANDPGVEQNAISIAETGTAITSSAATLTGGVNETKARVEVTTGAGLDLLTLARQLRLHPTNKPADDYSDDFVVYQAGTAGALTFNYKVDAERVFNVEFSGYPDAKTGKLFSVGDPLA